MEAERVHYCRGGEHCRESDHLCRIVSRHGDSDKLRRLVRESRYVCRTCGRTARSGDNLCKPVGL